MNSETAATPAHRGLFASLHNRLAQRPDSEHGQALIRIAIAIIGWLYVYVMHSSGKLTAEQHHILYLSAYVILAASVLLALIALWPQASPPRRLAGMAFDFSITSYFMYVMEGNGILFFSRLFVGHHRQRFTLRHALSFHGHGHMHDQFHVLRHISS